uniref:Uncharacterized protein n=1 Tax=viral metagenome TaxID=1070528 RepID=A0A6H1ZW25_9ZZZZ
MKVIAEYPDTIKMYPECVDEVVALNTVAKYTNGRLTWKFIRPPSGIESNDQLIKEYKIIDKEE